jgi:hypothetical protein
LEQTIKQMTVLATIFSEPTAKVKVMNPYRIDIGNTAINPWHSLPRNSPDADEIRKILLAELETLSPNMQCSVFSQWFIGGGKALEKQFAERKAATGIKTWCSNARPVNTYPEIAQAYSNLQGNIPEPERDRLLSELTANGQNCLDNKILNERKELVPICSEWISTPETIDRNSLIKGGKFRLSTTDEYRSKLLAVPTAKTQAEWEAWIRSLMPIEGKWEKTNVTAFAEAMVTTEVTSGTLSIWHSSRNSSAVIEVALAGNVERSWPMNRSRVLIVLDTSGPRLVGIPSRFAFQYDDGDISKISDLDKDGNPEIWFTGTDGECDGEDSKPGIDCDIKSTKMGEIQGNSVTYFKHYRSPTK